MHYILHYTEPGDVVFDGFCGTGMTGVAAQLCADREEVASLGYRVDEEGVVYDGNEAISRLDARRAVLVDLSPAATFIAYNYNTPVDVKAYRREAQRILQEVEEELGWMYKTRHDPAGEGYVDYIFTDPPFGENIYYADLNYLVESWHGVWTKSEPEAIIDQAKEKELRDYQALMRASFVQFYRRLKPGRWMTVEFHNSHNVVWNAIQEALLSAGFVVADVRTLDKQGGSYRQVTAASAAKQDLVISAYKPRAAFEARFVEKAGTAAGAWDFVRQHLAQLPVVVRRNGALEALAERQDYLLFDRMVAFHIQRGVTVPLSAAEFYAGLRERFVERDAMFFLPDQLPEYDAARLAAEEVTQLTYIPKDEKSAIQWLRQQLDPALGGEPQSYQALQPEFLRHLHVDRHEVLPELHALLEEHFLEDEAGRWYPPDPTKAGDLEQLRRKSLLREFREYAAGQGRLRKFRTEAVRAGFADAWSRGAYATIVQVAERLPDAVLQEDPDLLMYYDNASLRVEG
jgi:16S rRNA G966 N2-methylase RsmD